jgi:hypothetical protein
VSKQRKQTTGERIAGVPAYDSPLGRDMTYEELQSHKMLARRIDRAIAAAERRGMERGMQDAIKMQRIVHENPISLK